MALINYIYILLKKVQIFISFILFFRLSLLLHHMAPDMKISELSAALDFKTREDTLQKFAKGEINM